MTITFSKALVVVLVPAYAETFSRNSTEPRLLKAVAHAAQARNDVYTAIALTMLASITHHRVTPVPRFAFRYLGIGAAFILHDVGHAASGLQAVINSQKTK